MKCMVGQEVMGWMHGVEKGVRIIGSGWGNIYIYIYIYCVPTPGKHARSRAGGKNKATRVAGWRARHAPTEAPGGRVRKH